MGRAVQKRQLVCDILNVLSSCTGLCGPLRKSVECKNSHVCLPILPVHQVRIVKAAYRCGTLGRGWNERFLGFRVANKQTTSEASCL